MCKFEYRVALCACEDPHCHQKTGPLNNLLESAGHIARLTSYRRVSGLCLDNFHNYDPNRLVIQHGWRENGSNSKVDCKGDKKMEVHPGVVRDMTMCVECQKTCTQPEISPILLDMLSIDTIVKNYPREDRKRKKAKLACFAAERKFHDKDTRKDRKVRHKRAVLCEMQRKMTGWSQYWTITMAFNVRDLLYDEEKADVTTQTQTAMKRLPEARWRASRDKQRDGLIFSEEELSKPDQWEIIIEQERKTGKSKLREVFALCNTLSRQHFSHKGLAEDYESDGVDYDGMGLLLLY